MEWIERLNKAIAYIEEHMTEEISSEQVAKIACCSSYHFQRMFAYLADMPLSEYIRRRRMSLAAADMQSGGERIIDIALKYGYSSPTAFNRAFKSVHGIAPSFTKEIGTPLKSYPPISFKMAIKGVQEMSYRFEKKDAFRIVGISEPLDKELDKSLGIVSKVREKAMIDGTTKRLHEMNNTAFRGVLGVGVCYDERHRAEYENWRYFIAVPSTLPVEDLEEYTVPSLTWAIFSGKGTIAKDLPELERSVLAEWFPSSGYELSNGPDIEVFLTDNPDNTEFEIWLPIRKK